MNIQLPNIIITKIIQIRKEKRGAEISLKMIIRMAFRKIIFMIKEILTYKNKKIGPRNIL